MANSRTLICGLVISGILGIAGCSSLPVVTSEEMIAQWLDAEAELLGIENPPKVERVRTISPEEFAIVQIQCLQDQGFEARLTEDGEGVSYAGTPPEQSDQLLIAIFTCESKYPIDGVYLAPLDEGQLRALFDYRAGELSSCIAERGFLPASPPSFTTFYEARGEWSPYVQLRDEIDVGELTELMHACPQSPSLEMLIPQ